MATKTFPNTFHERKRNSNERWESSPKKKKQSSNGNGILLIQAKIRDGSDSLDLIPACVPQSVGLEIENILHNSFGHDIGPKAKRRSSPKKKSPRTMSTEDLHPNLLPEDYLDEVISQYFNNDSSSDDQDSRQVSRPRRRESIKNSPSDNSSTEEEEEEEKEVENEERNDDNDNPVDNKTKIKTCLLYTSPSPRDRQKSRMPSSA